MQRNLMPKDPRLQDMTADEFYIRVLQACVELQTANARRTASNKLKFNMQTVGRILFYDGTTSINADFKYELEQCLRQRGLRWKDIRGRFRQLSSAWQRFDRELDRALNRAKEPE
jgi:hypothetical protein